MLILTLALTKQRDTNPYRVRLGSFVTFENEEFRKNSL